MIILKYVALHMYKKNGFTIKRWQIIVIMKDSLLLNSGLYFDFQAEVMDTANYP